MTASSLLLLLLIGSGQSTQVLPPLDQETDYRDRAECLKSMRSEYDTWFTDLKPNKIDEVVVLATQITRKLPRRYLQNIQKIKTNFDRTTLSRLADYDPYTIALNNAFEHAAINKFPACASASSNVFGESIYWSIVNKNRLLQNEFAKLGARSSYYIVDILPVIVDFQLNMHKLDYDVLRAYIHHTRDVNESVLHH